MDVLHMRRSQPVSPVSSSPTGRDSLRSPHSLVDLLKITLSRFLRLACTGSSQQSIHNSAKCTVWVSVYSIMKQRLKLKNLPALFHKVSVWIPRSVIMVHIQEVKEWEIGGFFHQHRRTKTVICVVLRLGIQAAQHHERVAFTCTLRGRHFSFDIWLLSVLVKKPRIYLLVCLDFSCRSKLIMYHIVSSLEPTLSDNISQKFRFSVTE